MQTYSIIAAAELLGVSRQTVYRRVDKNPDKYTAVTDSGQRQITLQGLALLREVLHHNIKDSSRGTKPLQIDVTLQQELETEREHVRTLQADVAAQQTRTSLLQIQLDSANARIATLEATNATLSRALDQEQILHRQTQQTLARANTGFLARLFGKRTEAHETQK